MEKEAFEELAELNPDALLADGFEDAYIGYTSRSCIAVYNYNKCVDILVEAGMDEEEAEEYFTFNVDGAYMGEFTPVFVVLYEP